jgi:hypothetical protein
VEVEWVAGQENLLSHRNQSWTNSSFGGFRLALPGRGEEFRGDSGGRNLMTREEERLPFEIRARERVA